MARRRKTRARNVVPISIDGLRPDHSLDERWPVPALRQLYREGSHAEAVRRILDAQPAPMRSTFRNVEREELDELGAALLGLDFQAPDGEVWPGLLAD